MAEAETGPSDKGNCRMNERALRTMLSLVLGDRRMVRGHSRACEFVIMGKRQLWVGRGAPGALADNIGYCDFLPR